MSPTNGTTNGTNGHLSKTESCIAREQKFAAHNYHPLPVVFERALGAKVWDVEGKEYLDCLSAYSAVNQGHCHPRIVKALQEQATKLTLSSRAFHSSLFGVFAEKITTLLGYEAVLPMNTGAEADECAMKLARRWGYMKKGIPADKAIIMAAEHNFHGRTIGVISMSTDPDCRENFGPFLPRVGSVLPRTSDDEEPLRIRFGHIEDVEAALAKHGHEVAAFLVEPIQGEAGIIVPPADYLRKVQALCKQHNVLLILDEIQTGFGRTGKMMSWEHFLSEKPDVLTLGKALAGGVYPVSAVLASREVMDCFTPGSHGSTFGANPLACACAIAAIDVLLDEKLADRAAELGELFRGKLTQLAKISDGWITEVRGLGLLNAIVINERKSTKGRGAWHLCLLMKERGLLAKPTHENTIRLAPPLVITEQEIDFAVSAIQASLQELDTREVIEDLSAHHIEDKFVSL